MDLVAFPLVPLALVAACALAWAVAGKHVMLLTQPTGTPVSLATSLLAGMGLWLLVWLVLVPLGGGDTAVAMAVYLLLVLAMAGQTLRHWARAKDAEHHVFTLLLAHAVLLLPWLAAWVHVRFAVPADMQALHAASVWPMGTPTPVPPAWLMLLQAGNVLPGPISPWFAAGLNLLPLLAMAGMVAKVVQVRARWSNLLWVAVPTLAVAIAFALALGAMPLQAGVFSPLWAPLMTLAVTMPLLHAQPRKGMEGLPYALVGVMLVLSHGWGLAWTLAVAVVWLWRGINRSGPTPAVLLAPSLLAGLPLLACGWWLWHAPAEQAACVHQLITLPSCWMENWQPNVDLSQWRKALMACLLVWAGVTTYINWKHGHTHLLWIWAPLLLTGCLVATSSNLLLPLLGMASGVLLVPPLWAVMVGYQNSTLRKHAFRMPWQLGLLAGIPLFSLAMATVPLVIPPANPLAAHAEMIAADLAGKQVLPTMPDLAMVGIPNSVSAALAYRLSDTTRVWADFLEPRSLQELDGTLRKAKVDWALLGPAVAMQVFNLPPPLGANVLVQVQEHTVAIRAVYPLPLGLAPTRQTR